MEPRALGRFAAAVTLGVAAAALPLGAQAPDAARVLAAMRTALGGDALAGVQAFSVEGSEESDFAGRTVHARLEWVCALPDRFIEVRKSSGRAFEFTTVEGFNGDGLVRLRHRESPRTLGLPAFPPPTPASLHSSVITNKRRFSRFVMPLLGITAVYPYEASYAGRETLDRKAVHVLALRAGDGFNVRLYVDETTHLPVMLSWTGPVPPAVVRGPAAVRIDGQMGVIVDADGERVPLTGDAERRLFFSDFKTAGGLTWPHRLREETGRDTMVHIRLGKYKINPKVDPQRFVTVPVPR